jgi:transcriptional regulator with XRE-family HTH domain
MSTEIAAMVKALRERLGLSQQAVADRGGFPRPQLAKIETGHNKLSTADMRRQLAQGLGVNLRTLEAYIEGGMSLDDAVSTVTGPDAQTTVLADSDDGRALGLALVPVLAAVFRALTGGRHDDGGLAVEVSQRFRRRRTEYVDEGHVNTRNLRRHRLRKRSNHFHAACTSSSVRDEHQWWGHERSELLSTHSAGSRASR